MSRHCLENSQLTVDVACKSQFLFLPQGFLAFIHTSWVEFILHPESCVLFLSFRIGSVDAINVSDANPVRLSHPLPFYFIISLKVKVILIIILGLSLSLQGQASLQTDLSGFREGHLHFAFVPTYNDERTQGISWKTHPSFRIGLPLKWVLRANGQKASEGCKLRLQLELVEKLVSWAKKS